jgi:hypothetical protein
MMKSLQNVGSIVSVVFVAVGLFWLWKLGPVGTGLSLCTLGLISGIALAFGLYLFHLRDRIVALEKRLPEVK